MSNTVATIIPRQTMPKFACFKGGIDEDEQRKRKQHTEIEKRLAEDRRKYKATQRLLLLGNFEFKKKSFKKKT